MASLLQSDDDDVEQLINEVEKHFTPQKRMTNKVISKNVANSKSEECRKDILKDAEDILRDCLRYEDDIETPATQKTKKQESVQDILATNIVSKCFPVCVSGSFLEPGFSEQTCHRPCSRLRCLKCDFDVIHFDDLKWSDSIDYIFLRNNFPIDHKLRQHLIRSVGSRSYCCQCSHFAVNSNDCVKLTDCSFLRWVCMKHRI